MPQASKEAPRVARVPRCRNPGTWAAPSGRAGHGRGRTPIRASQERDSRPNRDGDAQPYQLRSLRSPGKPSECTISPSTVPTITPASRLTPAQPSRPTTLRRECDALAKPCSASTESSVGGRSSTARQTAVPSHARYLANPRPRGSEPLLVELPGHQPVWREDQDQSQAEDGNLGAAGGCAARRTPAPSRGDGVADRSRWPGLPLQQRHPSIDCSASRSSLRNATERSPEEDRPAGVSLAHPPLVARSSRCVDVAGAAKCRAFDASVTVKPNSAPGIRSQLPVLIVVF